MKVLTIGLIIVLNLFLQSTVLQFIKIYNVIPNTALILVVCFAINIAKDKSALIGFIMGILQDILFGKVIGINALVYMLIGYFISLTNKNIFKENYIIPFLFTSLATMFYYGVSLFFIYFLGFNLQFLNIFKISLIIEILYNAIISLFVYAYVSKIFRPTRRY
ncbi:rod shape-determining protein MreD [Natronincola ferrireducens]|uniref:Rod shape-determining protein MreD n=1 Tax=Natronincola ferrireducens TaxID=393762 RepID=A0A1G9D2R7_9FIRM|nr:rod shape-determining protein MreD [Natronincola ferrireducens]SDK58189.1 rod shape-determining protein MreD [Natronincola ferrireducens]